MFQQNERGEKKSIKNNKPEALTPIRELCVFLLGSGQKAHTEDSSLNIHVGKEEPKCFNTGAEAETPCI